MWFHFWAPTKDRDLTVCTCEEKGSFFLFRLPFSIEVHKLAETWMTQLSPWSYLNRQSTRDSPCLIASFYETFYTEGGTEREVFSGQLKHKFTGSNDHKPPRKERSRGPSSVLSFFRSVFFFNRLYTQGLHARWPNLVKALNEHGNDMLSSADK